MIHKHYIQKVTGWRMIPAVAVMFVAMTSGQSYAQDDALAVSDNGNVGLGISNPARQLHLVGSNATFRMDRDENTAAFFMVRTTPAGTPLKAFQVGTNASGSNNGEFMISDMGTAVGGPGTRRMTITNAGNVIFTGTISQSSSVRYKRDIEPLEAAGESLRQLQGVRFVRKETGESSLGLVAEDVAAVFPELVEYQDGEIEAVNYSALTAVLIEAVKEQQAKIQEQEQMLAAQYAQILHLEDRLTTFETLEARLDDLESLLIGRALQATSLPQR